MLKKLNKTKKIKENEGGVSIWGGNLKGEGGSNMCQGLGVI